MTVVAGNAEPTSRPLMQAAFNGFFKDLHAMSVNELTAAGTVLSKITSNMKCQGSELCGSSFAVPAAQE